MFYLLIKNKKTGRKTLHSFSGQTAVFDSEQEAKDEGIRLFGEDNPSVSCLPLPMYPGALTEGEVLYTKNN